MDNWIILKKELAYYGISLTEDLRCRICTQRGEVKTQMINTTIRQLDKKIKEHTKILLSLWEDVVDILKIENNSEYFFDDKIIDLFLFSLKDLAKFLLCFDEMEKSEFSKCINDALDRDIKEFNKEQIYRLPDYKISIDWIYRVITRLMYIKNILLSVKKFKKGSSNSIIKVARGISGPWSNLDLPMEERKFDFGDILQQRSKDKKRQRRYRKGFENYNNNGSVGEGHYWREVRNEPFLWSERSTQSPYPSRDMLTRWG